MDKCYTIAEIGKVLNIPESTVRYYRDRYSHYIPFKGQGRKKRYPYQALEVLRIIAEESNRNATAEAIEELLSSKFPTFIDIEDTENRTATTTAVTQQRGNFPSFELFMGMSPHSAVCICIFRKIAWRADLQSRDYL